jgi:hypothetical protein
LGRPAEDPDAEPREIDAALWAEWNFKPRRGWLIRLGSEHRRVADGFVEVRFSRQDVEKLARERSPLQASTHPRTPPLAAEGSLPAGAAAEAKAGEEAAAPLPQKGRTPSDTQGAGPLTLAVVAKLLELHPGGPPPGVPRKDLADQVRKAAGKTIGSFGLRTLDRARALAWPRPKRRKRRRSD